MSVCERCGKGVAQYCNHCMTDMHAEVLRLEDTAALPAGVYHSDGQGHVTPLPTDDTLAEVHRLWREDHERMEAMLAALSATDTETSE